VDPLYLLGHFISQVRLFKNIIAKKENTLHFSLNGFNDKGIQAFKPNNPVNL
jgi:hypothetical protein